MHPFFSSWHKWRQADPPFTAFRTGAHKAPMYSAELDLDHVRTSIIRLVEDHLAAKNVRLEARAHEELVNLQLVETALGQITDGNRTKDELAAWIDESRAVLNAFLAYLG